MHVGFLIYYITKYLWIYKISLVVFKNEGAFPKGPPKLTFCAGIWERALDFYGWRGMFRAA